MGFALLILGSIIIGCEVHVGAGWGCFLIGLGILFECSKPN